MAIASGSAVFTPPSVNELFSPRGQMLFKPVGSDREVVLGEVEDFGATPELTEAEYRSKSYPRSRLVKTAVFADAVNLEFTLKSLNRRTLAMLFMGSSVDSVLTQSAVTAAEKVFANPERGDIFDLEAFDVAEVELDGGTDGSWVLGTHYSVDAPTGRVEVLSVPDGSEASVTVTYSAPAIVEADGRQALGILEGQGIRGQIFYRELGAEGPFNWSVTYWDVEIRPSGSIAHMGGDEYANIELSGKVYATAGKLPGQEYGRVVTHPKA